MAKFTTLYMQVSSVSTIPHSISHCTKDRSVLPLMLVQPCTVIPNQSSHFAVHFGKGENTWVLVIRTHPPFENNPNRQFVFDSNPGLNDRSIGCSDFGLMYVSGVYTVIQSITKKKQKKPSIALCIQVYCLYVVASILYPSAVGMETTSY